MGIQVEGLPCQASQLIVIGSASPEIENAEIWDSVQRMRAYVAVCGVQFFPKPYHIVYSIVDALKIGGARLLGQFSKKLINNIACKLKRISFESI